MEHLAMLALSAVLLGSFSSSSPALAEIAGKRTRTSEPQVDRPTKASVGEAVLFEFDKFEVAVATPSNVIRYNKRLSLPALQHLFGYRVGNEVIYCSVRVRKSEWVSNGGYLCIRDVDGDGQFERWENTRGQGVGMKKVIDPPAKVRLGHVSLSEKQMAELVLFFGVDLRSPLEPSLKKELIFQGAAQGALRFLYREYKGDMVRPAFTQEAQYDFKPDRLPTTVAFQGARIEVSDIEGGVLTYVVRSPLISR